MPRGNRRTTPAPGPQPVNNDQNNPPAPAAVIAAGAAEDDAVREAQAAAEALREEQTGGEGQGPGEGPAAEGQEAAETRQEEQTTGEDPTPSEEAAEGQPAAETPAEAEARNDLSMTVQLRGGVPAEDIVATADVTLGGLCTIRNVKLKQDDYGFKVVMPRTRMPDTGRFKDACYFHSPELREQFDAAVKDAYQQTLEPTQEQGGMDGMTM